MLAAVKAQFAADCAPGVMRVVFLARLVADADRTHLTELIGAAIPDDTTGMFLLYPRVALVCVEAATVEQITCISRLLALAVLEAPRVILCTDATRRYFPAFVVESVTLAGAAAADYKPTETIPELAAECAVAAAQLGLVLFEATGPCRAVEVRPDVVPPPAKVDFLTRQDTLEPLTQFVAQLQSVPSSIVLDGGSCLFAVVECRPSRLLTVFVALPPELVWPVPQRLFPYD